MKKEICEIMGISQASYYRWKEERPIMKMILKYFTEKDLREFLETGKMTKLEKTNKQEEDIEKFFAHNGAFKLHMNRDEIMATIEAKEDISADEIEEIVINNKFSLEFIISLVKKSKSVEDFYKAIEEEDLRQINAILNPLEVQGMIKHKEYTIKKIRELEELEKIENLLYGLEDEEEIVDEYDDEDYEALERMRDMYGNTEE